MHTSFTGTRHGMTPAQRATFVRLLGELDIGELTHGDCVGADVDAHTMALEAGIRVRLRPCTIRDMRAFCEGGEVVAKPGKPLARNRKIVDDGEVLIATPGMMHEQKRSGVWATIRYALQVGREVHVIWPDGTLETRGS